MTTINYILLTQIESISHWSLVKIPFNQIDNVHVINDMDLWFRKYINGSNIRYTDCDKTQERYYFIENEEDAMAFKLKWL